MIKRYLSRYSALKRKTLALGMASMVAAVASPAAAVAAEWPTKPVRLVVGFAPGGGTDIMARALAASLGQASGQTIIVENKPGASGNISASDVVRANPDGYTLLVAPSSVETVNPLLFKSDVLPSRDLDPVTTVGRMQMYVVARPNLPVSSMTELIEMAKTKPDALAYSSSGAGTPPHLAGELLNQTAGTTILHVPYAGSAPALQDVMSGQVDFVFDPGIARPHIAAGKVKLLAVASDRKSPFFPDAPTYADLGIKDASLDIWFGVWAPKNVPADVLEAATAAITKALAAPELKERFNSLAAEPVALPRQEFRKLLDDEAATLEKVIKARKIAAQ